MWLEVALFALDIARNESDPDVASKRIIMDEISCDAAMEVLSVREQYFRDIVNFGIEKARRWRTWSRILTTSLTTAHIERP